MGKVLAGLVVAFWAGCVGVGFGGLGMAVWEETAIIATVKGRENKSNEHPRGAGQLSQKYEMDDPVLCQWRRQQLKAMSKALGVTCEGNCDEGDKRTSQHSDCGVTWEMCVHEASDEKWLRRQWSFVTDITLDNNDFAKHYSLAPNPITYEYNDGPEELCEKPKSWPLIGHLEEPSKLAPCLIEPDDRIHVFPIGDQVLVSPSPVTLWPAHILRCRGPVPCSP